MDHLGFGFKKLLDPRRAVKRHLKLMKRSLDPAGLLKGKKKGRRRRRPSPFFMGKRGMAWQAHERMRGLKQPRRTQGALPTRVVLPVASEGSVHALSDLGIKFHISRKWRKRIGIAAAVAGAAYFAGPAIIAKMGAKKAAMMAAKGAVKVGKGKLKKRLGKAGRVARTVVQARALPVVPGSVDYEEAAQAGQPRFPGMPGSVQEGGGGSSITEGGESLVPEVPGEPQQAGFGGLGNMGTILIVGGLLAAVAMSRKGR